MWWRSAATVTLPKATTCSQPDGACSFGGICYQNLSKRTQRASGQRGWSSSTTAQHAVPLCDSRVMPGVWVQWRSTACSLQPQHLLSLALQMPPHLYLASMNHVPLLFRKLPFKLSSSCVQLNLVLSKHPVPPPTQSTWVHWDPNFMDCSMSQSSHVCMGQAPTAHPLELSLSKLIF